MNFEDQLPKLISLNELLNFFDIDLELPPHLMELEFDECLKSSELIVEDGVYKLKYNNEFNQYTLTIDSSNRERTITELSGNGEIARGRIYSYDSTHFSIFT